MTVEICVGDLRSALEAGAGGADRVELCDHLEVGGTTPSAGTISEACRRLSIPVHVLIRPRAGDFTPDEPERAAMRHDVETARRLGASGVVFGMLNHDGTIDREEAARLIDAARPMSAAFHKAFDQTRDLDEALETLIALGVDRVLTSGGMPTAEEGADALARLINQAGDRIGVIVAGRLTVENLDAIIIRTGASEVHLGSAAEGLIIGPSGPHWRGVRAEEVRRIMGAVGDYRPAS
jgi:copper homeostasis protein